MTRRTPKEVDALLRRAQKQIQGGATAADACRAAGVNTSVYWSRRRNNTLPGMNGKHPMPSNDDPGVRFAQALTDVVRHVIRTELRAMLEGTE